MPEPAQIPADNNTTSDRTNTPAYRLSRVQRNALADIRDHALYIGRDPGRPDHGSGYSRSTLRKLTLAGLICGGPYEAGRGRRLMLTPTGRAAAGPGPAVPTRAEQHETVHACPPPSSGLTPCCGKTPFELPASDRMTSVSGDVTCSTLADAEAPDAPIPDAPRRQRIEAALEDCRTLTPTAMAAALLPLLEAEVAEAEERAKKAEDTLARVRWQVEEWQSWAGTEHAIRDMQLALGDIPAPQPQDPAALDHEQPTTGTCPTTTALDEAVHEEQPTARATQNPLVRTDRVLTEISEVLAERARHDDHRDKQTHVDGTGLPVFQHAARRYRDQADRATISGHLAWRDLLLAATYATLADAHPVRLRARLLHLATTTVAWIKDLDQRTAAAAAEYVSPGGYVRDDGTECCVHTIPVGPGTCSDCWDLAKWDALGGEQQ